MNVFIMQNSIVRPLGRDMQNVLIGFVGEHEARTFFVRTRDDLTGYAVGLVIDDVDCGAMTKAPMPDGSIMLSLTLTSDMLGKGGDKICQLLMTKDSIVRKSSQFRAYVGASNDINSTAPDSTTIIIISEKITELVHEAALDAITEVQEVIDSIPADYSELSAQVDTNTEDISGLKADLESLESVIASIDAATVPISVRTAIYTLLADAVYTSYSAPTALAEIEAWTHTTSSLTLDQSTASISGSGTVQLTATVVPSSATVAWTSSDVNVATVDGTGLITATGNGTCVITAMSGGLTATCTVTVTNISATYTVTYNLSSVESSNTNLTIASGDTYTTTLTALSGSIECITVTMRGNDITSRVYNNGTITIADVTGNIEITASTSLYALTSGTYEFATSGPRITVSNGNHIKCTFERDANIAASGALINLSLLNANGNDSTGSNNSSAVNNRSETLFTIPAGATVSASLDNITKTKTELLNNPNAGAGQFALGIREQNTSTSIIGTFGYTLGTSTNLSQISGTVSSEKVVSCIICFYQKVNIPVEVEFDLHIDVNGTRWI